MGGNFDFHQAPDSGFHMVLDSRFHRVVHLIWNSMMADSEFHTVTYIICHMLAVYKVHLVA